MGHVPPLLLRVDFITLFLQLQNQGQSLSDEMACLIQDAFFPPKQEDQGLEFLSSRSLKFLRLLFKNNPLNKYEKVVWDQPLFKPVVVHLLYESTGNFQCVAEISYDPDIARCGVKMTVLRKEREYKVTSKTKIDSFCRLLQKYNIHLSIEHLQLAINSNTGQIIIRHTLTQPIIPTPEFIKSIHQTAARMLRLVNEQMIFLIQCVDQNFQWEIYQKDNRYLQKIIAESNDTMRIRELIALSYISFKDANDNGQAKYSRNKELINFLSHRESMINPALKKQCFIGPQLPLFCNFMQPQYFQTHPISLNTLQNQFVQEFNPLFYNFQPKKMVAGDNPYLFNTILIKNEEKVKLKNVDCQGGFSRIQVAEVEIAYTESQNLVFDSPRAVSKNAKQQSDASNLVAKPCEKITYIPKVIAIKICKSESDYQKIKHERIIVQNFRTTTSPFILKYYNCTQRGFKYRQYLLMDYMGSNPTLLEYNQLHRYSFSLQFKMHIFIHISNALNFLEKQQVVHMDLSSHNVMIGKDLLVKLIDFGEAYHPYIDTDKTIKYNPGHTMPYCPPETFNRIKKFSPKSDTFSLGIILYRILFNDFPFFSTSQLKQAFINKSYQSRFMLAPERLADFGYQTQMMLMLQLISRCLSPVEGNRPNEFWMYVILNKIFLTLK